MSREELKETARKILDYRRSDHSQLISSLNEEDSKAIIPLFHEVTEEQIAKDRAELEAFIKREEKINREVKTFIAETDKFIAEAKSRRRNSPGIYFPFAMGEA